MGTPRHHLRRARRAVGSSLIEAMVSMAILTFGLLGALNGILFASQQNALAARMTRAAAVAAEVRVGLQRRGLKALADGKTLPDASTNPNALIPTSQGALCSTNFTAAGKEFQNLFDTTAPNACWIDLDSSGSDAVALADMLVPGYSSSDAPNLYQRKLFLVPMTDPDETADTGVMFGVGVFSKSTGKAITKQFVILDNISDDNPLVDL